jgi:hypothetical protein
VNEQQQRLTVVPCNLSDSNAFVARVHRHHEPVISAKFSLAVMDETGLVRGVSIVGRPKARLLDDGFTAEVNRLATDGCPNACSALYGASWRVARSMGYRRLITYILGSEPGTSLKASGWRLHGEAGGGYWNRPNLGRIGPEAFPHELKQRWEVGETPPYPVAPIWPAEETPPQLALDLGASA